MPEISVIMPVYNAQQFLNSSIHSLLKQSYTDFELILVNDGSTDRSVLYCNALAAKDPRIKVLDLPHGGQTAARIAGIMAAEGRYIGFIDSDDRVEKRYLEHLHAAAAEHDADISVFGFVYEYADGTRLPNQVFNSGTYRGDALEAFKKTYLLCGNDRSPYCIPLFFWNKLFKRELIMKELPYLERTIRRAVDYLFVLACFLDSRCISIVDDPDYHYIQRSGSLIYSAGRLLYDETARFHALQKKIVREKNYPELEYKCVTRCVYRLHGLIKKMSKSEIPPLDDELRQIIQAQPEADGCAEWARMLRDVKAFYL